MTRAVVFTLLGFLLLIVAGPILRLLDAQMVTIDAPVIIVLYMALVGTPPGVYPPKGPASAYFLAGLNSPARSPPWSSGISQTCSAAASRVCIVLRSACSTWSAARSHVTSPWSARSLSAWLLLGARSWSRSSRSWCGGPPAHRTGSAMVAVVLGPSSAHRCCRADVDAVDALPRS